MVKGAHRPFVGIVLSFMLGIMLHKFIPCSFSFVAMGVLILFITGACLYKKAWIHMLVVHFIFIGLGFLFSYERGVLPQNDIVHVSQFHRKRSVMIKGVVVSDVRSRDFFNRKKTDLVLRVEGFKTTYGWKKSQGDILVQIFRSVDIDYGDVVVLEGRLHSPYNFSPEKRFSYKEYLYQRGVRLILSVKKEGFLEVLEEKKGNKIRDVLFRLKKDLRGSFVRYLTKNESAIMRAMILGERFDIPRHIQPLFVQTGTAHILAISGLHVGIVAGLFLVLLRGCLIPRKWCFILSAVLLSGYALLIGAKPSVVRATIISVVFLLSFIFERDADSFNSLALSALLILLFNPLFLFENPQAIPTFPPLVISSTNKV